MSTERRQRILELARELGALTFGDFVLSSGQHSSYYFDGRLLSLDAEGSALLGAEFLEVAQACGATAIGGLTLGADPIVASVAVESYHAGTPVRAFIVRKETKEHGTGRLIEGPPHPRRQRRHRRRRLQHRRLPLPGHRRRRGRWVQSRPRHGRHRPPPGRQRRDPPARLRLHGPAGVRRRRGSPRRRGLAPAQPFTLSPSKGAATPPVHPEPVEGGGPHASFLSILPLTVFPAKAGIQGPGWGGAARPEPVLIRSKGLPPLPFTLSLSKGLS